MFWSSLIPICFDILVLIHHIWIRSVPPLATYVSSTDPLRTTRLSCLCTDLAYAKQLFPVTFQPLHCSVGLCLQVTVGGRTASDDTFRPWPTRPCTSCARWSGGLLSAILASSRERAISLSPRTKTPMSASSIRHRCQRTCRSIAAVSMHSLCSECTAFERPL
jgi:hypothetical protein